MLERPLPDGRGPAAWRAIAARVLPGRFDATQSYRLRVVADEIATWAAGAPMSAWERRKNVESLLLDLRAAQAETSDFVAQLVASAVDGVAAALTTLIQKKIDRPVALQTLASAVEVLLARLAEPSVRSAAWTDVVTLSQVVPLEVDRLVACAELLSELIVGAGGSPGEISSKLVSLVSPSPAAVLRDPEAAGDDWGDQRRIDAATEVMRSSGRVGHCIVWLEFQEARIPGFFMELGIVTLFDAEWCIGNATGPPHQDFPFRDELIAAWDLGLNSGELVDTNPFARQVIARVDLGVRSVHSAYEDAERVIGAVNVIIPVLTGTPRWQGGGKSVVMIDGAQAEMRSGMPPGPWPYTEPDYYGLNGYSDELERRQDLLAQVLSQPFPVDVAEALRLLDEADQVDSRENALTRSATIADRTVIVLQVSALERLAVHAQADFGKLGPRLAQCWPLAQYWNLVHHGIANVIGDRGGYGDALAGIYIFGQRGRRLSMKTAYDLRQILLDDSPDAFEAARAAPLVHSLGNAPSALALLEGLQTEAARLFERVLRCRNALVHGSPVSDAAVLSVRPFLRYLTDTALRFTLEGLKDGATLLPALQAQEQSGASLIDQLGRGRSFYESWSR